MTRSIDTEAFARDIRALRTEIDAALGADDLAHLRKIERWGRIATTAGLLSAWIAPNPVSAICLSYGRSTRWILMHHIGHRGYDRVPNVPPRYTSKVFAKGWRRFIDWPDWMHPDAWIYEHNVLHHAHTGQDADPDLIERNTAWVHTLPKPARWAILGLLAATWRASYYAKNTQEELMAVGAADKPRGWPLTKALLKNCWIPGAGYHFVALPLAFAPLGPFAVFSTFANSVAADVLTNIHTFFVVGPNHSGDDLYRFTERPVTRDERLLHQVIGTTNYTTGSDPIDCAHLFLNYQIEHHLYPDLPMLQYQRIQPRVKEICERHNVPYVQQSVFRRFAKMARNFVGDTKMRVYRRATRQRAPLPTAR